MSKRVYFYKMKKLCKQLNALIPIKSEEDRDKLNALIADMRSTGYDLYWDREVFIKSGCNEEKIREAVLHGNFLKFEPNEDYEEHPGVVVRFQDWVVPQIDKKMAKRITITESGGVYCFRGECTDYRTEMRRCKGCPLLYVLNEIH